MKDIKKHTGSYYTPDFLAGFISKRVLSHFEGRKRISILEPSVGNGSFIAELDKSKLAINVTAIDINVQELKYAKSKWNGNKSAFINSDFLNFNTEKKFSAIIGNPPYVKKSFLKEEQIEIAKRIHEKEGLSETSVKNIWTTFLIKSNTHLASSGVLAFVLPSELLQVKFAEEIREYLKNQFQRIEIFTFNDLMFECKGQDTIVLFAYKLHSQKGEYFTNIVNKNSLIDQSFELKNNDLLVESKVKWTHHFLSNDEIIFLKRLKESLSKINDYCESKPGIVTAANKFFIIDRQIEEKFNLSNYTKPIIQKGYYVNGSVEFNYSDFANLENKHPSRLIQLNNSDIINNDLKKYLEIGVEQEIPKRYKCTKRNNWYVIPNIANSPDAFFFKRSHHYPKLLKNNTNALVTDSAYKVMVREGFDLNSLIFSFYNSLTLAFSEIDGRYYGGGVLELTPNEFKNLPIPYVAINNQDFVEFVNRFENKNNINEVLHINDKLILNKVLNLSLPDIEKIQNIRKKLITKRMR
ncbi:methyltransferase [Labilibaculum sp. K2S]|uniref:Eco57I restriction-modification methylase domain-containing protein n=1 Tax=Labilibaculum sp. K2S TaxID=3056386 RepID=UPI0025A3B63C|nr:methyltransferase [Labilibaculum sp. K2S]MDM8159065.1 methyltransferase [Labilibaculum sp. K2S]